MGSHLNDGNLKATQRREHNQHRKQPRAGGVAETETETEAATGEGAAEEVGAGAGKGLEHRFGTQVPSDDAHVANCRQLC